jgi:hypothetical protein
MGGDKYTRHHFKGTQRISCKVGVMAWVKYTRILLC